MNSEVEEYESPGPQGIEGRLLDQINVLVARVRNAERERDEALDGLKPFALIAEWDSKRNAVQNYPDERLLEGFPDSMDRAMVTIGHCRRAAEIISKHAGKVAVMLAFLVLTGCTTPNVPICTCTSYEDHWSDTK